MLLSLINNSKISYNLSLVLRQQIFPDFTLNNSLNLLPSELIEEIASNLDIEDLLNLCRSNIKYQYLCSDSYIINKVKIKDLERYYDRLDILEILIKYRKDITEKLNEVIRIAFLNGNLEIVKLLLADARVNPADRDNWNIRIASSNGYPEIVQLLLNDARVNPAAQNNAAIIVASYYGHLEVVKLLLADPKVDPADQNNAAIKDASENGHLNVVKLLLADIRVDPTTRDNYAIRQASFNGRLEVVKLLLSDERVNPSHLTYEEFFRRLRLRLKL